MLDQIFHTADWEQLTSFATPHAGFPSLRSFNCRLICIFLRLVQVLVLEIQITRWFHTFFLVIERSHNFFICLRYVSWSQNIQRFVSYLWFVHFLFEKLCNHSLNVVIPSFLPGVVYLKQAQLILQTLPTSSCTCTSEKGSLYCIPPDMYGAQKLYPCDHLLMDKCDWKKKKKSGPDSEKILIPAV